MKFIPLKIVLLVLPLIFISLTSHAAIRPGAVTLTPFVSGHFYDSDEGIDDAAEFGLSLGFIADKHWGVELTASYSEPDLELASAPDIEIYSLRVDALYHFQPEQKFVPYLLVGGGEIFIDSDAFPSGEYDEDLFVNYGLGFKYDLTDMAALRADVRHYVRITAHDEGGGLYDDEKNYQNVLASLGVTFQFGGSNLPVPSRDVDTDRDGVIDSLDRCPGTAFRAEVDAEGCPIDSDGDGVPDVEDDCPDTAYGAVVDAVGCSPDQVNVRLGGELQQPRSDVTTTAGMDSDGDSVLDVDDHCPNTPYGVKVGPEGCGPDEIRMEQRSEGEAKIFTMEQPVQTDMSTVAALESAGLMIKFEANGSGIHPQYFDDLRSIAAYLSLHPDARLMVEGHTDSTGPTQANRKLSQHRADTVRWILVRDFGADPKRIVAKGYGETQPIADNDSQTGRAINRRVILKLLNR